MSRQLAIATGSIAVAIVVSVSAFIAISVSDDGLPVNARPVPDQSILGSRPLALVESTAAPTQSPVAATATSTALTEPAPPEPGLIFLDRDGFVYLYDHDTRSEEAREADPMPRAGWEALPQCMLDSGFDTGAPADSLVTWTEVQEMVAYVNSFGPNSYREMKTGGLVYDPTEAGAAFIDCHSRLVGGP